MTQYQSNTETAKKSAREDIKESSIQTKKNKTSEKQSNTNIVEYADDTPSKSK